jgi:hypothetical protein
MDTQSIHRIAISFTIILSLITIFFQSHQVSIVIILHTHNDILNSDIVCTFYPWKKQQAICSPYMCDKNCVVE